VSQLQSNTLVVAVGSRLASCNSVKSSCKLQLVLFQLQLGGLQLQLVHVILHLGQVLVQLVRDQICCNYIRRVATSQIL
jgi:hypothetical protein